MASILASTNAAGVVFLFVIAVATTGFGLAILKDWRGVGSAYHRITMRSPMPGMGFYRDPRTFQVVMGAASIGFGLVALVLVAIVVA